MNVISWENGDTEISDYPKCSDQMLARLVQNVNDNFCTHVSKPKAEEGMPEVVLLCADCSVTVLELAHRTPGTTITHLPEIEQIGGYLELAMNAYKRTRIVGAGNHANVEDRLYAYAWDFLANHTFTTEEFHVTPEEADRHAEFYRWWQGLSENTYPVFWSSMMGALEISVRIGEGRLSSIPGRTGIRDYCAQATWNATINGITDERAHLRLTHKVVDDFERIFEDALAPVAFPEETLAEALRKMCEVV